MGRFCFAECEDLPIINPVLTFISGDERVHHCLYLCSYLFNQLNDPYLSCSCHFTLCLCVCSVYCGVFCPLFLCFSVNVSFSIESPVLLCSCVFGFISPRYVFVFFCFSWFGLCLAFMVSFSFIWI